MVKELISIVALLVGLVLGAYFLWLVAKKYKAHHNATINDLGLIVLGVVLLGLSMWKTIDVAISTDGVVVGVDTFAEKVEKKAKSEKQPNVKEIRNALSGLSNSAIGTLIEIGPAVQKTKSHSDRYEKMLKSPLSELKEKGLLKVKTGEVDARGNDVQYRLTPLGRRTYKLVKAVLIEQLNKKQE